MFNTSILPLAACLLLITDIVLSVLSPRVKSGPKRIVLILAVIIVSVLPVFSFIPVMELPLVLYARAIVGDLSIPMLAILVVHVVNPNSTNYYFISSYPINREIFYICLTTVPVSLVLFATALGWTYFDPYAHGYYPTTLSAALLTLFVICFREKLYFISATLGATFLAYALRLMDADNLWNYLTDPVLLVYGVYVLTRALIRDRQEFLKIKIPEKVIQTSLLTYGIIFILFSVSLGQINEYAFGNFIDQYSFIEWSTALLLLATSVVLLIRAWKLKSRRSPGFIVNTIILAVLCLWGAGLWGAGAELFPTLFPIHSPKSAAIDKTLYAIVLSAVIILYLCLTTLLYRTHPRFRQFIDSSGIPVASNYQIGSYLGAVILTGLLMNFPAGVELLQFAASIVIMLNLVFPSNRSIYI